MEEAVIVVQVHHLVTLAENIQVHANCVKSVAVQIVVGAYSAQVGGLNLGRFQVVPYLAIFIQMVERFFYLLFYKYVNVVFLLNVVVGFVLL